MTNAIIASNAALMNPWRDLWNGDMSQAKFLDENLVTHVVLIGGVREEVIRGREALVQWISGLRAAIPDLKFSLDVGPIADEERFVVRWKAQGTYHGGMPGVPAESAGRKVDFSGTDILRIAGGKIAEYWGNTDSLLFAQQLGMVPSSR
jgi:predicted ester cyclase